MKILVTGAAGFLGKNLSVSLLKKGYSVFNFSRGDHFELLSMGIKTLPGDLAHEQSVVNALEGMDAVFHVASQVGMWGKYEDFYRTNVLGTQNIIKACRFHGIKRLIYTSTPSVVFGSDDLCGVDETTPNPRKYFSHYAKTKAQAEKLILDANGPGLCTVALRPHLIFGPDDPHLFPRILDMAQKGKLRRVGNGKNLVDVTYIDNVVDAHLLAFEKLIPSSKICGQVYFLGQERPVNLWDFVDQILILHKLPAVTKKISARVAFFVGWICEYLFKTEPPMTRFVALQFSKSHYFSHKKAEQDFGYSPKVLLEEALKKSIRSLNAS